MGTKLKFAFRIQFSKTTKTISLFAIISLFSVLFIGSKVLETGPLVVAKDTAQNFAMGYHLYNNGVLALGITGREDEPHTDYSVLKPTAFREPAYPIIIAGLLKLYQGTVPNSIEPILKGKGQCRSIQIFVWYNQLLTLFLLNLITAIFLWKWTSKLGFSLIPIIINSLHFMIFQPNAGSSETLAKLLFLITSILLFKAWQNATWLRSFAVGIATAGLALTKVIFAYMLWPIVAVIIFAAWKRQRISANSLLLKDWRNIISLGIAVVIGFYALVGPWLLRNHQLFGQWVICHRAGDVLLTRSFFNKMTLKEYGISFLWWTPVIRKGVEAFFSYDDYKNLDTKNPDGYGKKARKIRMAFIRKHADDPNWRSKFKKYSKARILEHPVRHILTTIPFAYRGIFFMSKLILFLPFVLIAIIHWWRKRYWDGAIFLLPSMYCFFMHAAFTHNIPRYNESIMPITGILAGVGLQVLWQRFKQKTFPKEYQK